MKLNQIPLTDNLTIKVISLIIGYLIWSILSQHQCDIVEKWIPICFYNNDNFELTTNEFIKIKLSGLRKNLWFNENNAVHIDASFINEKKDYTFSINPEHIFLRQGINLISYEPTNIVIQAK